MATRRGRHYSLGKFRRANLQKNLHNPRYTGLGDSVKGIMKDRFRRKAQELLPQLEEMGSLVRRLGKVQEPVPIRTPDGKEIVSWFVAITVADKIASFMQFDNSGTLIRYSSFQRQRSSLEGCPKSNVWLSASYPRKLAKRELGARERIVATFLSYHQNPQRIAWVVKSRDEDGRTRTIYVAGDSVFRQP